ncbi:MAG: ParA family protein [Candidatus Hydrogenedentes bacterium]|nr:ParA family protein [Candidatus Hydrogenedentota bacterium]
MGRIIAIANQKGGVGKTTTAVNLSACLALAGKAVLLVDLDPQGNATQGVGVERNGLDRTTYEVLIDGLAASDAVVDTQAANLRMIPSTRHLAGAEVELVDAERREFRLRDALVPLRDAYEYLIVDCPPSLGLLTVNGLTAADRVLIPMQCEYYALEGLSELIQTVMRVRDGLNPGLSLLGVLLTMFQHTNLARQVETDVRAHLGNRVFNTVIPRNISLSEAPSFGQPIAFYDPRSPGARAYHALAQEVLTRG